VLNGSQQITFCCWVNPDGQGENGGYLLLLGPPGFGAQYIVRHAQEANKLEISKGDGLGSTAGKWTIPITDGAWNGICIRHDFSNDDNDPTVRVNFKKVTPTETVEPEDTTTSPDPDYYVGNNSVQTQTWDGRIAQVQVFNKILTDAEADSALIVPGSVNATNGLRLWLPMKTRTILPIWGPATSTATEPLWQRAPVFMIGKSGSPFSPAGQSSRTLAFSISQARHAKSAVAEVS
jgi:hypothetical protein